MQYRELGKTGMKVSAVVYGGIVSTDAVQADSDRYVAWAIEQGINYFDVAPTYGDAQLKLGNSLILPGQGVSGLQNGGAYGCGGGEAL